MNLENGYMVLKVPPEGAEKLAIGEKEKKVCEVCGCANEANALMCKMCSNYLTKGGKK